MHVLCRHYTGHLPRHGPPGAVSICAPEMYQRMVKTADEVEASATELLSRAGQHAPHGVPVREQLQRMLAEQPSSPAGVIEAVLKEAAQLQVCMLHLHARLTVAFCICYAQHPCLFSTC